MGFTKEQSKVITTLTEASACATLVGTLFIIVSYLAFKEIRQFHLRLIFFLAIADFMTSIVFIANLHSDISNHVTCNILAAALEFSELASAIWSFCIAFVLDQVIRLSNYRIEQFEKWFHIVAWGIPGIIAVVSWLQGIFIDTGFWCWISDYNRGLYRWLYFYAPLVAILFYVVAVYFLISRKISNTLYLSTAVTANSEATIQKTFRWYIIGWTICWLPAIVDRIQDEIDPGHPIYVLTAIHSFVTPLAGFCNAIAYGFNDEIQAQYGALLHKCLGGRFRRYRFLRSSSANINSPETKHMKDMLKEYDYAHIDD